jgi:pyruvate/2-oxoglutarate dehydrogenase complex dihydrolipoamide dehydrogenase (E3) component
VADVVLVAAGRAPALDGLGLERAGVDAGREGVVVDDRLRTTNPRVYAIGDATPHPKFTHLADAHARLVVPNALFFGRGRASRLVVPWATYTAPEVAHVGLTHQQAAERDDVETLHLPLAEMDRARTDGETDGFLRLYVRRKDGVPLGATVVAARAGDIVGELSVIVTNGIPLARVSATIHPYPTTAEIVRRAADQWRRRALTPTARRFFAAWFRVFR